MPEKIQFVDPHIHLWDLATRWYPLLEDAPEGAADAHGVGDFSKLVGRDFLLADYFEHARDYDVTKVVHITAAQQPPSWPDETAYLQQLFERQGHPHGIIGWTDFDRPIDEVDAELGRHADHANFRGIRHQSVVDYGSSHVDACFEVMQRRGLIYDVVAHEESLPAAAATVKRFGDMSFVLEHAGWPSGGGTEVFSRWRKGMAQLAEAPNAAVKISGLGMPLRGFDLDLVRPWVEATIELFGPDRCMFASNFPVDWLFCEYSTLLGVYQALVEPYSEDERAAMFAGTAEGWYRI